MRRTAAPIKESMFTNNILSKIWIKYFAQLDTSSMSSEDNEVMAALAHSPPDVSESIGEIERRALFDIHGQDYDGIIRDIETRLNFIEPPRDYLRDIEDLRLLLVQLESTSYEPFGTVAAHSALTTGVHGVGAGTVAQVGDIAVDANLSAAAQDAISKRHTQGSDTALGGLGTKNPPIDADKVIYRDSAAADVLVTSTWTQVKAFLKTYFDGLYEILGATATHSALTTGVHGVGAGTVAEIADIAVDANLSVAAQAAIAASHARSHAITGTSDHTSTATPDQLLKADASGLPVNATNTDAAVASAVAASHGVNDANSSSEPAGAVATHAAIITGVHGLVITAGQTITVEASSVVNQDLTSDASPTFATVKLTGLTDDYIPYHVSDAAGLANGPTKINVDSAVSLKHTQGTDTALGAVGTKNPPIDADKAIYRDSTAGDALVTSTWTQVKAFLKTYFDTLYVAVTGRYRYAASVADDATVALPTITANYAAHGFVVVSSSGVINESAEFEIDSTGTCQIIRGTANVVVNADTDTKFCLGTVAAQNPMSFKNRLGGARNVMINLGYN